MNNGFLFSILKVCLRSVNNRLIFYTVGDCTFSVFGCNSEILVQKLLKCGR